MNKTLCTDITLVEKQEAKKLQLFWRLGDGAKSMQDFMIYTPGLASIPRSSTWLKNGIKLFPLLIIMQLDTQWLGLGAADWVDLIDTNTLCIKGNLRLLISRITEFFYLFRWEAAYHNTYIDFFLIMLDSYNQRHNQLQDYDA